MFGHSVNDTSSIREILSCREEALRRGDDKSAIYLDLRRSIVYQHTRYHRELIRPLLEDLLRRAIPSNDPLLLVSLYIHSGVIHNEDKDYSAALLDYLRAYNLYKDDRLRENTDRNYPLYNIAFTFYQFNDYQKALEVCQELKKPMPDPFHNTLTTNLMGMCYLKLEKYDSARYWFNEAVYTQLPKADQRTGWQGITDGNIGNTWYLQHEYDKAIPFLKSGIEKTAAAQMPDNTAGFECILADIYLSRQQPDIAFNYLKSARHHTSLAGKDNIYFKLYSALSKYYRQAGDARQTLLYQDSMLHYQTRLNTELDQNLKVQAEYRFQHEQWLNESAKLKAETNHQKGIRNLLIAILFLLMVVVLLIYHRQRLKYVYHVRQMDLEKQKAEEELAFARIQLDDFTRSLKEKNQMLDQFSEELFRHNEGNKAPLSAEQNEIFNQLRQSAILTDEHWEEFRKRMEKVHGGYLLRLRTRLPDLSPAETRFMALAKLQLNNKEMSGILGVSTDSIRMMRHRLRKKLNLDEEGSLEELINSI